MIRSALRNGHECTSKLVRLKYYVHEQTRNKQYTSFCPSLGRGGKLEQKCDTRQERRQRNCIQGNILLPLIFRQIFVVLCRGKLLLAYLVALLHLLENSNVTCNPICSLPLIPSSFPCQSVNQKTSNAGTSTIQYSTLPIYYCTNLISFTVVLFWIQHP